MSKSRWSSRMLLMTLLLAPLAFGLATMAADDDKAKADSKESCAACCADEGPLSGIWTGEYRYGEGMGLRPTTFTVFLFQHGDRITALIKEPNTFGDQTSPWLHATADGRYDKETKAVTFTKSYDGTAGVSHDVVYKGQLTSGATETVQGTWDISGTQGTFTMKLKSGAK